MPIKSDLWIHKMSEEKKMIEPFSPKQVRKGISFGLSSYGYDFRLSTAFKIHRAPSPQSGREGEAPPALPVEGATRVPIIDPKKFSVLDFEDFQGMTCTIPPNSFVLGRSLEYFRIPRNILTICYGKSTYARCGISINVTPFEPEWEGFATISITNNNSIPALVYAEEGIGQLLFLESDEICATSYADKQGKYQAQQVITGAKI
ncbi:MAG: dCTP deaminase [Deltaproteobacteria bacterium]|nr:dCTP deaminase [Deltaproteobacteria bacterium]